jgi:recombination protein RecT
LKQLKNNNINVEVEMADLAKVAPVIQLAKSDSVKKRFEEVFNNPVKASSFIASMINVVNGNGALKKCDGNTVIGAALVAAALDLPVDPNLGFAYIIPYGNTAQLQLGYKSFIQLAMRSGQYKNLHASEVFEDELDYYNPITGEVKFTDMKTWKQRSKGEDKKVVGFYGTFELNNGFKKELFMSVDEVKTHAKKYSKSYGSNSSKNIWQSDFEAMALKTVLKRLISKWGILSVDMQRAVKSDQGVVRNIDNIDDVDYDDNPQEVIIDERVTVLEQKIEEDGTNGTNA